MNCIYCSKPLVRRDKEAKWDFRRRKTCGRDCQSKYALMMYRKKIDMGKWKERLGIEFFLWGEKAEAMMKESGVPIQRLPRKILKRTV